MKPQKIDRIPTYPDKTERLSAQQLRWRYVVALSLIAVLTILSQAIMQFLIADQNYDARVVNLAGRQRMLSQKISKLSYYIASETSSEKEAHFRVDLEQAVSLWERSHAGLLHGDGAMGLPGTNSHAVVALFERIAPPHRAMVVAARAILAAPGSTTVVAQSILTIRAHETEFLTGMDEIVSLYEREAKARVEFARWLELGLMSLTLLVLVLEATLIFAPATRRIARDIKMLAHREEDMERLFGVSPTALLLIDRNHLTLLRVNQRAISLMGRSMDEIRGTSLRDYLREEYAANRDFLAKITTGDTINEYEVILIDTQRSLFETLVSVREISFAGQAVLVLGITNITELKKAQQTLEHYATFDEMTGLLNRRTGLMMLEKSMAGSDRSGAELTVCFVDLDGLKAANDNFGHAQGDWLIRTVAQALTGVIRSNDAVARLGGDEFLLILNQCSFDECQRLVARAEARMAEMAQSKAYPIDFSYGVVTYVAGKYATADELVSEADRRMYLAKQAKKRAATGA